VAWPIYVFRRISAYLDTVHHADFALLVLRVSLGLMLMAHGANKVKGGLDNAGRWFSSMGMRHGGVQARLAALVELGCGALLVLGLLTPFAAAGVIGVMLVAGIVAHRQNGFFVFRPGQGWEYVYIIAVAAFAIGAIGAGDWSIDHAIGIDVDNWWGALVAGLLGIGSGVATLAVFWRPPVKAASS
jgi:putative oxidoreductase